MIVATRSAPQVRQPHRTSDEDLLASHDTQAFGLFYDRHARTLLGYFVRRTGDPEVAADLTAETFASAIAAQRRYVPADVPAAAWLYTIAARRLSDYRRHGVVESRMRERLAMRTPRVAPEDADVIRLLGDDAAASLLAELPAEQRRAVSGYVVDGRSYADLASEDAISEAAIRQRVSRGLAGLRRRLGGT